MIGTPKIKETIYHGSNDRFNKIDLSKGIQNKMSLINFIKWAG